MSIHQELFDRAYLIHTTFVPFREYSRLLKIDDIDEYISYGGLLKSGEKNLDDTRAYEPDASFRDVAPKRHPLSECQHLSSDSRARVCQRRQQGTGRSHERGIARDVSQESQTERRQVNRSFLKAVLDRRTRYAARGGLHAFGGKFDIISPPPRPPREV